MTLLGAHRRVAGPEGNILSVARAGRLIREGRDGPRCIALTPVDEDALDLLDRALERRVSVHFLFPAPASEVSVLLAAQVLIRQLIRSHLSRPDFVVGLVTADVAQAIRTWHDLRIATTGSRESIAEVFACHSTGPNGEAPSHNLPAGIMVGHRFADWPVNLTIVDHLAGQVDGDPPPPTVHLFADPLDPLLEDVARRDEPVWAWLPAELGAEASTDPQPTMSATALSAAASRLAAINRGMRFTIRSFRNADAERALRHAREDLRHLHACMIQSGRAGSLERGLRVAWHRLSTLASLPCAPSQFDRFAGLPPWAARPTQGFAKEIASWARTLSGDAQDYASILASDLEDLRASLERAPAFLDALASAAQVGPGKLVVVRSRTAARSLIDALGGDPDGDRVGSLVVRPMASVHKEGAWDQALVVGVPPRWQWYRLDSGLSREVQILALGKDEAGTAGRAIDDLRCARSRWASKATRERAWSLLVGDAFPMGPLDSWDSRYEIVVPEEELVRVPQDPFDALGSLFSSTPLVTGDEDIEDELARPSATGQWTAAVEAVAVTTDQGTVTLEVGRSVEVRVGTEIKEVLAEALQPGMRLLIGRTNHRLGLLDALEERLVAHRPDLVGARLLMETFGEAVRSAFERSGLSVVELHRRLRALGCDKTYPAVRGWVTQGGPMAPRDPRDVKRLDQALGLQLGQRRLVETIASLRRWRGLRIRAGRLLAEAAVASTVARSEREIDRELGLSVAELREAVTEAVVRSVTQCARPVPLSEIGRLE